MVSIWNFRDFHQGEMKPCWVTFFCSLSKIWDHVSGGDNEPVVAQVSFRVWHTLIVDFISLRPTLTGLQKRHRQWKTACLCQFNQLFLDIWWRTRRHIYIPPLVPMPHGKRSRSSKAPLLESLTVSDILF